MFIYSLVFHLEQALLSVIFVWLGTREETSGKKSSQNSLWEYYLCCHWTRSDRGGDERKKLSDSEVSRAN